MTWYVPGITREYEMVRTGRKRTISPERLEVYRQISEQARRKEMRRKRVERRQERLYALRRKALLLLGRGWWCETCEMRHIDPPKPYIPGFMAMQARHYPVRIEERDGEKVAIYKGNDGFEWETRRQRDIEDFRPVKFEVHDRKMVGVKFNGRTPALDRHSLARANAAAGIARLKRQADS